MNSGDSYAGKLSRRPPGLNELGGQVFDVLAAHTAFPWPILETQARRSSKDPFQLTRADLRELAPRLLEALARFASPDKVEAATQALGRLAEG